MVGWCDDEERVRREGGVGRKLGGRSGGGDGDDDDADNDEKVRRVRSGKKGYEIMYEGVRRYKESKSIRKSVE